MAPESHVALSFDEILQRDREARQRKEAQDLANDIFGRGRKDRNTQNGPRRGGMAPTLASRVGIAKTSQRSTSNPSRPRRPLDSPTTDSAARLEERPPRAMRTSRQNPMFDKVKDDLLSEALIAKGATNQSRSRPSGPEISIRGAAGPYVVIASNFAPGTTAADIESAMVPSTSEVTSCRIITSAPTVMAEIVFTEKQSAQQVIDTFNNKKADGRLLHVYLKTGGPAPVSSPPPSRNPQQNTRTEAAVFTSSDPATSVDPTGNAFERNRRRADPLLQDGRYGFANKDDDMDVDAEPAAPTQPAARQPERQDDRRQNYDDHYRRSDQRYPASSREYNRGGYYDRGWGSDRPRHNQRQYSNSQYERYPRGYR